MLTSNDEMAVLTTHVMARSDLLLEENPYRLVWVEPGVQPEMGAWNFRQQEKVHEILLSRSLDEEADQCEDRALLAKQVYFHEVSHSLWTERDFDRLRACLCEKKPEVPLRLLNLFEDARIEAVWRRLTKRSFDWTRWFLEAWEREPKRSLTDLHPAEFFLHYVQTEASTRALRHLFDLARSISSDLVVRIERILHYYLQATEEGGVYSRSTLDLIPLCRAWMREFPPPEEDDDQGTSGSSRGHASGDEGKDQRSTPNHTPVHGGDLLSPAELSRAKAKPKYEDKPTNEALLVKSAPIEMTQLFVPDAHRGSFDFHKADPLEPYLARVLHKSEGNDRSVTPRKRFSTRDHIRGSRRVYRGKSRDVPAPSRLMYLHDCSGSMQREPAQLSGLTMLQIINRLHRHQLIDAKAYLCFGRFGELPLPFDEDLLNHLVSLGPCEGFEGCLKANESVVRWADRVMVYTDGRVTDKPIDRARWRRQGVESYGMLVGDKSKSEALGRWFDHVIVRPTIEDLVVALADLIRREFF